MKASSTSSGVSPELLGHEHVHRRRVLLGLASILLLSIVPTVGHHLPWGVGEPVGSLQHFGAFCAAALRSLLRPVHSVFHAALGIGLLYASWDRLAAWRSSRASLRLLEGVSARPDSVLGNIARKAGLDASQIVVVPGLPSPAFTAGLIRPRVFVSSDLEHSLGAVGLQCVMAHEAHHVRRRDPLRLSVYRFLGCLLFWMPGLKALVADITDDAEIEADDGAAGVGSIELAAAILSLASDPRYGSGPPAAVGFHAESLTERRIRRLAGETPDLPGRLRRRSIVSAALLVLLVVFSGAAAARPSASAMAGAAHCNHHGGNLLSHLWCSPGDCRIDPMHCDHSS